MVTKKHQTIATIKYLGGYFKVVVQKTKQEITKPIINKNPHTGSALPANLALKLDESIINKIIGEKVGVIIAENLFL